MPDSMYEKIKAILSEAPTPLVAVIMLDWVTGTPYVAPETIEIAALVVDKESAREVHEALMRLMRERLAAAERNN